MSRYVFRTQLSDIVNLVVDDGDPVEGFIPGASESPETLLARLRQGGEVAFHDGNRFITEDFFDAADSAQKLMYDEEDRAGGTEDPENRENPNVEQNSINELHQNQSAQPAQSPASAES